MSVYNNKHENNTDNHAHLEAQIEKTRLIKVFSLKGCAMRDKV